MSYLMKNKKIRLKIIPLNQKYSRNQCLEKETKSSSVKMMTLLSQIKRELSLDVKMINSLSQIKRELSLEWK